MDEGTVLITVTDASIVGKKVSAGVSNVVMTEEVNFADLNSSALQGLETRLLAPAKESVTNSATCLSVLLKFTSIVILDYNFCGLKLSRYFNEIVSHT